jgi:hypothetical protein
MSDADQSSPIQKRAEQLDTVTRTVSVDEWLTSDRSSDVLFALAPVAGRDDLVQVTPWLRGVGPLAMLALELPKAVIAGVRPAAEGTARAPRLAYLDFRSGSEIALDELYRQIAQRPVAKGDQRRVEDFFVIVPDGLVNIKRM